jgi:hypothetical protein
MQVVQTDEPPPKTGRRVLATIGCTEKSRHAERKTVTVKTKTMRAPRDADR